VAKLSADRSFVWVKRNLTPRQHYAVNRLGIPGLYFQREERRVYPHGPLAAHVLGFTDIDNRGIAGVEQHFDRRLKDDHQPLALSIDIRMQHVLREELARAVAEFSALGGGGVILDATSGEILAMVSLPDFDPNAPGVASPEARFNRNTLGVYEMGSVFKIFTTAMALDSGVTSLSGGYDASRPIRVSRYTITDYHPKKRWLSVPEIFMYSSNIGSARMALDVGPERQRDFLGRLGMLKPLALELPELGEPQGPSAWKDLATMTIAFGHGLSVTPMHMAAGVSAIVNGGRLIPTTLTRRDPRQPVAGVQVIRPDTSEAMRRLMRLAVERGTGKNADVPGYRVGGKTGTAEKVAGRRYKHNALFSSFVAAFPIEKPRFVLFIALDEPQATKATHGFATGGWIAAPVAARVIERVAPIAGVAPIEDETFDETDGLLVAVTAKGGD
jgi:cell division protein FtsI (penicillin-binding protein 3)